MAARRAPIRTLRWTQRLIILAMIIALFLMVQSISKQELLPSATKPVYSSSISVKKGDLGFKYPQGIAVSPISDRVYVTSAKNSKVFVFDKDYKLLFSFNQNLKVPVFIAINKGGQVHVTDRAQKAVLVFNEQGQFLKKLKLDGLDNPLAIAIDSKDNIYLSNTGKQHQILKFNPQGELILKFGYKKRAVPITANKGGFFFPNGIAVDSKQNIYVADSNNERVQIFDKEGHFKTMVVTGGLPRGIALNERAKVFLVADALRHKIYMHDMGSGKQRSSFSQLGSNQADVAFPNGIVINKRGLGDILVVDRENNRIQIFKTRLSITVAVDLLRPYLPFIPLPFLIFALLFLTSRKRRYIITDCFLDSVMKNKKIPDFVAASNAYHIAPSFYELLGDRKLVESLKGVLTQNKRFSHHFVERVQRSHKLNQHQAEALALAHHRGIYKPVLLAYDKKLLQAADYYGIQTMDLKTFFHLKKISY